jgi:hypothetical protein
MTKRRIMVSIPDDVIDAMTLQVDGVEVRSLSHLIEILCSREAAQTQDRTEARRRRPMLNLLKTAATVNRKNAEEQTEKHAKNKKGRAR